MAVLAIDTSNQTLSVALENEEGQRFETTIENTLQHSVQLMPAIDALLKEHQQSIKNVTKIVIAKGPGSYTGLRIGVTVAKTLAKTLNIPLVAISSLVPLVDTVCSQVKGKGYVIPFFDARRDYIFTGIYRLQNTREPELVGKEVHISWQQWLEQLQKMDGEFYFVGKMTEQQRQWVTQALGNRAHVTKEEWATPHATSLIRCSEHVEAVDADIFVPTYLKLAEAEENWRAAHQGEKETTTYVERI